ncbi:MULTISPECIES: ECF transporter S component [Clostridium]|uniref:Riboflavin transporter n=2 Tax=Clostridium TaxID=1485 RepID=A0A151ANZ7_9CLOT|nr:MULTISPECIES: ECF transporter S component [Clostridium]KYH29348.1 riboflavin transporter RibU [Clostridium colicanis DSM 13634]MBE6043124.1 ECF transporter S component [Clostridium thermopalmarium]PRR70870.1 Riboflavin transporter RibU [Clostridium thermopalmarium DSM 5974]PVZ28794.1 riboflavin transporter FmnP [Clostridium thermopalmarium DSM 5974]
MRQKGLNTIIKISLLSVMAFILMFFEIPLPIFPSFLKIDLSDLPALFGAFALGPAAGIGIELLKNILHIVFKGTQTGFVGELANFAVGATLAVTAGTIYRANKSKKTAILGLVVGSIVMSVVAAVLNYTVLLPLYAKVYKAPIDAFVAMGATVNPNIKTVKDLVMWSIFPFNLLKGVVVSAVTVPLYKRVSPILHSEVIEDKRRTA